MKLVFVTKMLFANHSIIHYNEINRSLSIKMELRIIHCVANRRRDSNYSNISYGITYFHESIIESIILIIFYNKIKHLHISHYYRGDLSNFVILSPCSSLSFILL